MQGADRYYDKLKEMIGYYPSSYMKYCWKFITPSVCFVSIFLDHCRVCKAQTTCMVFIERSLHVSFFIIGNTVVLSDQVHPYNIQQDLPVPMVGLYHWSISYPLFSSPDSSVVCL